MLARLSGAKAGGMRRPLLKVWSRSCGCVTIFYKKCKIRDNFLLMRDHPITLLDKAKMMTTFYK